MFDLFDFLPAVVYYPHKPWKDIDWYMSKYTVKFDKEKEEMPYFCNDNTIWNKYKDKVEFKVIIPFEINNNIDDNRNYIPIFREYDPLVGFFAEILKKQDINPKVNAICDALKKENNQCEINSPTLKRTYEGRLDPDTGKIDIEYKNIEKKITKPGFEKFMYPPKKINI